MPRNPRGLPRKEEVASGSDDPEGKSDEDVQRSSEDVINEEQFPPSNRGRSKSSRGWSAKDN